ncbi:MAG: outer membrane protein assembly factor BamD [Desulfobacteraceae bacterium]|nr:outer membrane protein assembly factor BamD [Desulfobacteraceae bacterium]
MIPWFLAGIFILLLFNGCALWNSLFGEEELTPAELMSQGVEDFNDGKFEAATESFQKIKDRYPYSEFAIKAELKMADALYERDLFDEAYDEYTEFEKLHPRNPEIPYVVFQKGMCNFSRVSTIDRDQTYTWKAKEDFERLIKRYRRSAYTERARKKVRECYIKLAEHELYVGNFYFKMEKYQPAMSRYLYLIENYPDVGQYYEALEKIKICREKLAEEKNEEGMSWWGRLKSSVFN